ncbi:hypothetical protein VTN77DRAFT_1602 [Rasamsonia byssochlamydoides]|uniref:uncharacterized protein n=1 Tax=Rasamsonia byssochlamydoides TaxID=89139 RepID=UPI00374242C4
MSQSYSGGCLCGKIKYRIDLPADAPDPKILVCHCISCKAYTGSAFSTNITVPEAHLKFTTGEPELFLDPSSDCGMPVRRQFCRDCGSPLTSKTTGGPADMIVMKWGTLDNTARRKLQDLSMEIYCRRKDRWLEQLRDAAVPRRDAYEA